jgi:hypothetical protein
VSVKNSAATVPTQAFLSIDVRALAAFRVAIALILLRDLYVRLGHLRAHYTDAGVLPRSAANLLDAPLAVSLHSLHGAEALQGILFLVAACAALALLVGLRTRAAVILCWLLLLSLHHRNPLVLNSGDIFLRLLLFWSMFLPLGAALSIDALRQNIGSARQQVLSVGTAAILLQVAFVYWFTVFLKEHPSWLSDGTALFFAFSIEQHAKPFALALLSYPVLLQGMTWSLLLLEVVGPLFAIQAKWPLLRVAAVGSLVCFHLMSLFLLELGIFPWVSATAWLLFLPPRFWDLIGTLTRPLIRAADNSFPAPATSPAHTERRPPLHRAAEAAGAIAFLYVLAFNVTTVSPLLKIPDVLAATGQGIGLNQRWAMFAPYPLTDDGWYVIRGALASGEFVDLQQAGQPLQEGKPDLVSATYPDQRWRKYMMNLWNERYAQHRPLFARHLCQEWNRPNRFNGELIDVEVVFMLERMDHRTRTKLPAQPNSLYSRACVENRFGVTTDALNAAPPPAPPPPVPRRTPPTAPPPPPAAASPASSGTFGASRSQIPSTMFSWEDAPPR